MRPLLSTHTCRAAIDEILAEENIHPVTQASDVLWSLGDHIGSIRDVVRYNPATNTTQVANHLFYDAFGNIVSESDVNLEHRFAFTGREWDEEIDLQYNRARYYDPQMGRWISKDPLGFDAGDMNLYRYVGNGPTIRTDASGLDWIKKFKRLKFVIKDGVAIFENGKTLVMRNWKYRNKAVSVDDLIKDNAKVKQETLDFIKKNFPDLKIKYDKWAQPDFSEVAKYTVPVNGMTGIGPHDAALALKALESQLTKKQYKDLLDNLGKYRLHHSSTGQVQVVPKEIHEAFAHTGAASFMRAAGTTSLMMAYTIFAPGCSQIQSTVKENPEAALEITEVEVLMTAGIDVILFFDPFFESAYEYTEEDLAVRIPTLKKAPETIEKARHTDMIPWLDGVFEYWDILTGDFYW